MSIENPYGLNPGWKIDPDGRYDRSPSKVTTRKMTKAEKIKYGNIKGQPVRSVIVGASSEKIKQIREREKKMGKGHKLNLKTEDLLRICRIHGTGGAGYTAVAKELGMSWHTAKRYICGMGIVKLLKAEQVAEENRLAAESVRKEVLNAFGLESMPEIDNADEQYNIFMEMNSPLVITVGDIIDQLLPVENEEYPDITEAYEAAREGVNKIKQNVDEMVPDIKSPLKFYIATGYQYKDRAAELSEFIKAIGGEITCEWWNNDESTMSMKDVFEMEFQGIRDCDIFVCMLPGFAGTHSELGAAVMLGKQVIVHAEEDYKQKHGNLETPCYFAKNVKKIIGSELMLAAEILKVKKTA